MLSKNYPKCNCIREIPGRAIGKWHHAIIQPVIYGSLKKSKNKGKGSENIASYSGTVALLFEKSDSFASMFWVKTRLDLAFTRASFKANLRVSCDAELLADWMSSWSPNICWSLCTSRNIKCLALTLDRGRLAPPTLAGDSLLGPQPGNGIFS